MLRNQVLVELARENLAEHQRILGLVRAARGPGRGSIADVRQTEARIAAARDLARHRDRQSARRRGAATSAWSASGRRSLEDPLVPYPAVPESQEAAAAKAAVDSPTVLIADADIEVAEAELRGSRAGYYPRFDLELGAAANDNLDGVKGGDVEAQALLVLRYNLFRGGADIAREREAFARLREAREGLRQAQRDAEEEARVAYNALQHRAGPPRTRCAPRSRRSARPATSTRSSSTSASAACSTCSTPRTSCSSPAPT